MIIDTTKPLKPTAIAWVLFRSERAECGWGHIATGPHITVRLCLDLMAARESLARIDALADELAQRAHEMHREGRHGDSVELGGIAREIRAVKGGR